MKINWSVIAYHVESLYTKLNQSEKQLDQMGRLFFNAGIYHKAADYWENLKTQPLDYFWAKYLTEDGHLDKISYLLKLRFGEKYKGRTAEEYILEISDNITSWRSHATLANSIAIRFYNNKMWDKAQKFWDDIRKQNHPEYFWARYHQSSGPIDKIRWLTRLPDDHLSNHTENLIFNAWDEVKKDADQIASLTRSKNKYRLIDMLYKKNRLSELFHLVKEGMFVRDWIELSRLIQLGVIEERIKYKIFSQIANSPWGEKEFKSNIEMLKSKDTGEFSTMLKVELAKAVKNNFNGFSDINVCELGAAIEKIVKYPLFTELLQLYEYVIERKNIPEKVLEWAKCRWIKIKYRKISVDKKIAEKAELDGELSKAIETKNAVQNAEKDLLMKKQSWKTPQEIPDFPPPPFPQKNWREVLLDLKQYFQEYHSKEELTLLLVERLLSDNNMDMIYIDWKNLKSNLDNFKDKKVSGYLEKLDILISKIQ